MSDLEAAVHCVLDRRDHRYAVSLIKQWREGAVHHLRSAARRAVERHIAATFWQHPHLASRAIGVVSPLHQPRPAQGLVVPPRKQLYQQSSFAEDHHP